MGFQELKQEPCAERAGFRVQQTWCVALWSWSHHPRVMSLVSSWEPGDKNGIYRVTEKMKCIVAIKHLAPGLVHRGV